MNLQEKKKRVEKLRLIDDVFFEMFAEDIPACQEMLRIILEDNQLMVKDVIVQSSERNLYGRSVRLDALCSMGDGSDIADLMDCFMQTNLDNPKFPAMTRKFQELKNTEGGLDAMCKVMQNLIEESNAKIIVSSVENIVKNLNLSTAEACKALGYSLEVYESAVTLLTAQADSE